MIELGVYERQNEMGLRIPEEMHILGVGGVGFWTACNAALLGVDKIHIYDEDKLEISNRNRLPYSLLDIGNSKTELCERAIAKFRNIEVIKHPFISNPDEVLEMDGVIVNAMDYPMKALVQMHADKKEIWTIGANDTRYSITNKVLKEPTWSLSNVSSYTGICAPTVIMAASHTMGLITVGTKNLVSISNDIRMGL